MGSRGRLAESLEHRLETDRRLHLAEPQHLLADRRVAQAVILAALNDLRRDRTVAWSDRASALDYIASDRFEHDCGVARWSAKKLRRLAERVRQEPRR